MLKRAPAYPLGIIQNIYDRHVKAHGPTPEGVFWKNIEGQVLRYEILTGIVEPGDLAGGITVNDLGCGYGVFFDIFQNEPLMQGSAYYGYDLSGEMVKFARRRIDDPRAHLIQSDHATKTADYSLASGTFNMHGRQNVSAWETCVQASLKELWGKTRKGLAFNMLAHDREDRLDGLYYANSADFIDFCRREISGNVELIDGYPLEEWTIFIRR